MNFSRRDTILMGLGGGALMSLPRIGNAKDLRAVRVGIGFKAMSPGVINLYDAEPLGYAAQNGLQIKSAVLGSGNNVMVAIEKGAIDIGVVASSFILPMVSRGQMKDVEIFYEYTYPYKWDIAVKPGSSIKTYSDLKGKKLGVSNFGNTDYPVTQVVLKGIGIDPKKDVSWVAVGEGVTAGIALDRGEVDALAYFDSGFGTIENAGIKFDLLPRPAKVPMIGGLFLGCTKNFLKEHEDICVAYGRCVAMSSIFLLTNPAAGAAAFLKMFPQTAPRNVSHEKAVEKTVVAIKRRIKLYEPPYPNAKMGQIFESEFETETKMRNFKVTDFKSFYTNALIDKINDFDKQKVIADAKAAKI